MTELRHPPFFPPPEKRPAQPAAGYLPAGSDADFPGDRRGCPVHFSRRMSSKYSFLFI
jgi:hypothetical protein